MGGDRAKAAECLESVQEGATVCDSLRRSLRFAIHQIRAGATNSAIWAMTKLHLTPVDTVFCVEHVDSETQDDDATAGQSSDFS